MSYKSLPINAPGRDGQSQLHRAAERGDVAEVQSLLEQGGDIFMTDGDAARPRCLAVENGRSDVIGILDEWRGKLFSHFLTVVEKGDVSAAKVFSENTVLSSTESPMLLTASVKTCRQEEMVAFLLNTYRFPVVALDESAAHLRGNTPTAEPLDAQSQAIECLLLSRILYDSIIEWKLPELKSWTQRVPRFNIDQKWNGKTTLHLVAAYGRIKGVEKARILIELGANTSAENDDGLTAEQLAMCHGRDDVAAVLRGAR
ncbi:hypothetical protein [Stenotrophomonas sp. PD6]|uniref:hypothetical protein n=1 Tax=Stenotrophomonas sp. PD6 TaxID=3368612 RepID=UPI003BA0DE22